MTLNLLTMGREVRLPAELLFAQTKERRSHPMVNMWASLGIACSMLMK